MKKSSKTKYRSKTNKAKSIASQTAKYDDSALQNVQLEDIEKVSLRYHTFDEVELNSDIVVRIRQNPETDELPIYIVSLIDHKSKVDHNVSMQLLTYMVCI